MDFLDKHSKISGLQGAKRKFHITETTLLHYTDQLLVLVDMSKAFDSIQHDNLLSKLHVLGVSASTLAWFKSHLSLHKQLSGQDWQWPISTRNMSQLNLPKCSLHLGRLSTGQRSFAFRGAKEYNLLPENIRNLNNIWSFKRIVAAYFLGNSS